MPRNPSSGVRSVLEGDEVGDILRDTFYSAPPSGEPSEPAEAPAKGRAAKNAKPKPDHYKVICISFYTEDLKRLDAVVRELKRRGFTKANRSAVLRIAMEQIDLDRVRKGL